MNFVAARQEICRLHTDNNMTEQLGISFADHEGVPTARQNHSSLQSPRTTSTTISIPDTTTETNGTSRVEIHTVAKGPLVTIQAVKQNKYVTTTVVRGLPTPCADTYYHFLRRQLNCTGYRHDNGEIELFRVTCMAVKVSLDRLRFSERDLNFEVVGEA